MPPPGFHPRNRLLKALPRQELSRLKPYLEPVALGLKQVLVEPRRPITQVHFVEEGIASVVAVSPGNDRIEVAHVGCEGLTGDCVLLGVDYTLNRTFVQVAGSAFRIGTDDLKAVLAASPAFRAVLLRWVHVSMIQMAQSALANGRYSIQQRVARWLLMGHDRMDGDDLPLTHEFLSLMLGVRRSGVTEALHVLEEIEIVKARRGHIRVLSRERLEEIAGGCYGLAEGEYAKLIG